MTDNYNKQDAYVSAMRNFACKHHYLVSTRAQPGVYNSPFHVSTEFCNGLVERAVGLSSQTWGVLQIQDQSPQSRPVASLNQPQMHSDMTGLNCGDQSWICNMRL